MKFIDKIIKNYRIEKYNRIVNKSKLPNTHILTYSNDGIFMYLDPPYDIKDNLYGKKGSMHKGFDHDKFAYKCDQRTAKMLISYNSSQLIKDTPSVN